MTLYTVTADLQIVPATAEAILEQPCVVAALMKARSEDKPGEPFWRLNYNKVWTYTSARGGSIGSAYDDGDWRMCGSWRQRVGGRAEPATLEGAKAMVEAAYRVRMRK